MQIEIQSPDVLKESGTTNALLDLSYHETDPRCGHFRLLMGDGRCQFCVSEQAATYKILFEELAESVGIPIHRRATPPPQEPS